MHDTDLTNFEAVEQPTENTDEPAGNSADQHVAVTGFTSRRKMLRNAAIAAGGAVAATVATGALPAAANDPNDITKAVINTTAGKTTLNGVAVPAKGNILLVQSGATYTTDAATYPSAVGAWTTDPNHPTGLYAYTSAPGENQAVAAVGSGPLSYGLRAFGVRAPLFIEPLGLGGPARVDAHQVGELIEDAGGELWLCVVAGTPGTWRKLAGPATAGAFHPISQVRVYDSRSAAPTPGKLASGASRVVSVKDGRDPASGAVNAANAIPAGATAITGNVTVTETSGQFGGFLTVMPGDAPALVGSTVNWFGPNQNIANSFVAKLDAGRQVKVFCGGAPNPDTHFIIDVTGYYL